jgi:ElaB/YqjD/DUF883 family membrane-anchored ribosome-binding protein
MDPQQQSRMSPSSMSPAGGVREDNSKGLVEQAGEVVRKAGETAQQAQHQLRGAAARLSDEASSAASGFMTSQIGAGADFASEIAHSMQCAADELGQKAPQLGRLVHRAARRVDDFAGEVRDKTVEELFEDASDFARRQPALVFGAAAVLGFAMFRMLKVGAQLPAHRGSGPRRFADGQGQQGPAGSLHEQHNELSGAAG